jgi:hypothetical protein
MEHAGGRIPEPLEIRSNEAITRGLRMNPWKRKEVLGDCTLYLGDCLEILPTLEKVDAVITDGIMGHEKPTGREHSTERTGGGALGIKESGDRAPLPSGRTVTGRAGEPLRGSASGNVQGAEAPRHQGEVEGAQGRGERALYSRDGEHALPEDGEEECLREMRRDQEPLRASQERKSSRQQEGKPSNSVLTVSQQTSQKRMVGKTQDFSLRLFA